MTKIYTKKGDEGMTQLVSCTWTPKHALRIECYGTVDELNAWIGLISASQFDMSINEPMLYDIQNTLFTIGSLISCDDPKIITKLPQLSDAMITELEESIDMMEEDLEPLRNFVLPGGTKAVANIHIARTVCRRAERLCSEMTENNLLFEARIIKYMNRLSDWLFVFSRKALKNSGKPEIIWQPRKIKSK